MNGTIICLRAAVWVFVATLATACGGGGPSNVGTQPDLGPVAVATVIGGGNNGTMRSGSVVLLSTKDSDGQDSPILKTVWRAQDPAVVLQERTSNSVAFEAPNVAVRTNFMFTATVFDAEDQTDSVTITITVVPAGDLNKFLTVDGPGVGRLTSSGAADFRKFTARVNPLAPDDPVAPGDSFSLTVDAVLNYADRNANCVQTAPNDPLQCVAWTNNATVQLVSLGYPLTIANVNWNASAAGFATETLVELNTPDIDASLINQFIIDALPPNADESARDALLDLWRTDSAEITLTINLVSPIAAVVTVSGPNSSTVALGPNKDVTVGQILADASDTLQIETAATADAYYKAIDPDDEFLTLSDWLFARGFTDAFGTLLPDASSGAGEFAHAIYTNNFDLGFGRDMFTRIDKANGNVYSYVTNYPTLQNTIEKREEFVTVVMDYSPPGGTANNDSPEPKFTKFYVYAVDESTGDQVRMRSIDFDGRGLKYVPGACTTCHGGTLPSKAEALAVGGYFNQGNVDAGFFPWDLESFLYSDTDPAIPVSSDRDDVRTLDDIDPQRRFTRSAQEDQFRKLNMAALATFIQDADPARFAAPADLVRLFYPAAVPAALPADCILDDPAGCLVGSFSDGAVPADWVDQQELYTDVYARYCRACHTQLPPESLYQFLTSTSFLDEAPFDTVFRTGVMPMARLTMDRLWAGTETMAPPIDVFRRILKDNGKGDFTDVVPGAPIPRPAFVTAANADSVELPTTDGATFVLTKTGRTVTMTGEESLFYETLDWSLADSSADSDFPACLQDPTALLADGTGAYLSPDVADDYCVALTASRADYTPGVTAAPLLVRAVDDRPTEVAPSNCGATYDGTTCVAVDEFVAGAAAPDVVLSAQLLSDPAAPVAIAPDRLSTTLLALRDQDQLDGLDAVTDFVVSFASSPSAGSTFLLDPGSGVFAPTAQTSFGLNDLIMGRLKYRSDWDNSEIVAIPTIDTLSFDVLYPGASGDVVAFGSAQVLILPKSDSAPTLSIILNGADTPITTASVAFNSAISGSFLVTDADFGETVLDFTRLSGTPTLGALSNETDATVLDVSSGSFTYTAGDAEALETANANLFNCKAGGGFAAPPQNTLSYQVTTGVSLPGESDNQSLTITIAPSVTDTTDTGVLGVALEALTITPNCNGCHIFSPLAFPTSGFAAFARSNLFNAAAPGDSRILTDQNHTNFKVSGIPHTGGPYTAAAIVRTWVFECAP